jgi:hypothetical protein
MNAIARTIGLILGYVMALSASAGVDALPKISGRVLGLSGAPVPHLQLSVFPFGPNPADSRTDANGRYAFSWSPHRSGSHDITYCLVARDVARNLAAAMDLEETTTNIDLRLEPALVVTGRVQDSNARPLGNAAVQASLWTGSMESQFGGRVKPDAEGRFSIAGLPTGRRYTIRVSVKNLGSATQPIETEASLTNRVELPPFVFKLPARKLAGQVMDEDEKPAAGLQVNLQGEGQFFATARTDENGRFAFDAVCEGTVRLVTSRQKTYASATVESGDTNVLLRLGATQLSTVHETPRRSSLEGQPLPDLTAVGLARGAAPAGKPILLCLFDIEQRPSRRFVRLVSEQHDGLTQKGIVVLGLQAAIITPESFKEWLDTNPSPIPVGRLAVRSAGLNWASDVESLPWLILTDKTHHVAAEGFTLDELEAKLKSLPQ